MNDAIRIEDLKILLISYKVFQKVIEALKNQIYQIASEREGDVIYDLATRRIIDGMPASGKIQDKTANIALKSKVSSEARQALVELRCELNLVSTIVEKLDIGFMILKPNRKTACSCKVYERYDLE